MYITAYFDNLTYWDTLDEAIKCGFEYFDLYNDFIDIGIGDKDYFERIGVITETNGTGPAVFLRKGYEESIRH